MLTTRERRGFIALLQLLTLLASACSTPGPIRFGIYSVPEKDLARVKEMGMDFVVGPREKKYLDAADEVELKVLAKSSPERRTTPHGAILGEYLTDEPDLMEISPEAIAVEYQLSKRTSKKPVFLNLSSGFSSEMYVKHCDVLMFDWYPIGWQPIETFISNLRVARIAAREKPFFAVIQTFNWAKYPAVMPSNKNHRKPTAKEVKAMAVWAAMAGAAGIAFYPYDDGYSSLSESPELIDAIKEAIKLIREHEQEFGSPRIWAPYPFTFQNESDKYNDIFESSLSLRYSRPKEGGDTLRLMVANSTSRTISVTGRGEIEFLGEQLPLQFEPLEIKFLQIRFKKRN